ncbi:MAG: M48 family metalloprotease [Gemmatimonadetes bacterium]|uniref:M48 family metalloprotease n=1 Tax=Candidatus Kutchimonas denitrificans TaxID=3056748 RepID=A0AAE4Z724_9BACT|nr:M48 family metalloprotease [Gemmatimonadota bacterium]NIR74960.1 M48 family metalloprotease [Candidatus Kutchimonas denitrificans]NIS00072.1 M48 family metalloprotease [Gemmatimonadota bacterium]NIT65655.1 M48 family metalloprotease [Gemmatimonadota bacterium]NIU52625.1 M48 family metalloprotease [Gemmatimonadota bacterium]
MRAKTRFLAASLAALSFTQVGCPVNPATGERQLILISQQQEIAMGQEYKKQVVAQIGLYDDPQLQEYVSEIGMALASESEMPDLPWSFQVVDDPVVNAFALPGGPIFVTRGILAHFGSEAELAGVLGHEIGHVTGRHSAEQMSRAQAAQLGLGVGSIFVPEIAAYGDLIGAGVGILFLKFGRDDERQSDDLGLRYMRHAGYDPRAMVGVFDMLGRVSEAAGGGGLPTWLSTHPAPENREARMDETLDSLRAAGASLEGTVARDRYLGMIDGVVFGEDPRNGYFEGQRFLHPDLRFRFDFPAGWRTQNTAQAVAGISEAEDAIIQLRLGSGASPAEAATEFFSQGGVQAGNSWSERVSGLPARWSYFSATTQDGQTLRGLALFVELEDTQFQILGYTPANRMGTYDPVFRGSLGSFGPLTDPAAINVEPRRIDIVQIDRAMTLREFADRYPSTVDLQALSLINRYDEDERIPAGAEVKRVVGGRSE